MGLVLRAASEITSIPGYKPKIDSDFDEFQSILRPYYLPAEIKCALCGAWHKEGYLVSLREGEITNIGHICGRGAWVAFQPAERIYLEQRLRPKLLANLNIGKLAAAQQIKRTHDLRGRAMQLGRRKLEFTKRFPLLTRELVCRAHSNNSAVTRTIERSEEAIDDLIAANPRQSRESLRYEQVPVATLQGLSFFLYNVHETVVVQYVARLESLNELEFSRLTTTELIEWDLWIASFAEHQRAAERVINAGEKFLDDANVALLPHLAHSAELGRIKELRPFDLDVSEDVASALNSLSNPVQKPNRATRRLLKQSRWVLQ